MNKKDIIQIAKSLYLEQTISRQLFAKFDPNKQINQLGGSFARLSEKIQSVFYGFIGSKQRVPYPQIVQKNGMNFKIHKINLDNTVSTQIYNNTEYTIDQIAFVLRKIHATAQGRGDVSFKNSIKYIEKLWNGTSVQDKYFDQTKQTIIDKLQQIKQVFISLSDFIVGNINYIETIRDLQDSIQKLNSDKQQKNIVDQKINGFINDFKGFINSKQSYVQVINMAVNRLKSFIQLYNDLKSQFDKSQNQQLRIILNAMQLCNTNKQVDESIKKINLKQYLNKSYSDLNSQDESIQSFIRFIKNIDNGRITQERLNQAIDYYLKLNDDVVGSEVKQCLKQLKLQNQKIQKDIKEEKIFGTQGILNSKNLSQDLIRKLKQYKKQLI